MPETHSGNPYCGRSFVGFSGQRIREDRYTVAAVREAFPDGTAARAWRGADVARLRLAVELCATYWHYLLAVWVVLYALLVSNDLGLAICSSVPL